MKAIVFTQYGSPDVLQLKTIEKPVPNDDQVLIKIHATAINPLDWHRMRADPILVRFGEGLLKPKNTLLGADIAGTVEAVGKNVTEFHIGDEVFGEISAGGLAEYVCVKEQHIAPKPVNLTFEEAASTPVVAFTALQGLRDTGKIKSGQKVLINGASGGVGTFAVQLAKSYGAEVTGVCSGRNADMVRSIGADHVIDYTKEDFTKNGQQYDLIYDAIGNRSASDIQRALKPNGRCVIAGFTTLFHMIKLILFGMWITRRTDKTIGMMPIASPNKEDLMTIKELLESGKVVPVIDRHYPLTQTAEAIRYLETGRARGKVIVTINA